jgi:hypothetical protein
VIRPPGDILNACRDEIAAFFDVQVEKIFNLMDTQLNRVVCYMSVSLVSEVADAYFFIDAYHSLGWPWSISLCPTPNPKTLWS